MYAQWRCPSFPSSYATPLRWQTGSCAPAHAGRSGRVTAVAIMQMMAGKPEVVVITGASAGVGRATVQRFARAGAHIGLIARGVEGLEAARAEVERAGGKALVLPTDVADAGAVEDAAERVER